MKFHNIMTKMLERERKEENEEYGRNFPSAFINLTSAAEVGNSFLSSNLFPFDPVNCARARVYYTLCVPVASLPGAISHGALDKSPESYPRGVKSRLQTLGKYPITTGRLLMVASSLFTCMPGINLHLSKRSAYLNNRSYTVAF